MPATRHHGADVVSVESQVWRAGSAGCQKAEAPGRGESQAEECSGRADAGQPSAEGCSIKKLVKPVDLRKAAQHLMAAYGMSERHVCRLVELARSTSVIETGEKNAIGSCWRGCAAGGEAAAIRITAV